MRKIFEAIGKVTTRLIAVVIGIYIARFLPLWLEGIIAVCAFVFLVLYEMEEKYEDVDSKRCNGGIMAL